MELIGQSKPKAPETLVIVYASGERMFAVPDKSVADVHAELSDAALHNKPVTFPMPEGASFTFMPSHIPFVVIGFAQYMATQEAARNQASQQQNLVVPGIGLKRPLR
jgi:hypothetical protein